MTSRASVYMVAAVAAVGFIGASFAGDAAKLVGTKSCKMCHSSDAKGNQHAKWLESSHSKAYAVLASDAAKETGKKVGVENPQQDGKCLKCHSTAYNNTETKATEAVAVEDGVSCESCHGPGADYKAKATMENKELSIKAGMVSPATQSCTKCHNEQSPSWNPERYTTKDGKKTGFDVEQAAAKIAHPNPAAAAK